MRDYIKKLNCFFIKHITLHYVLKMLPEIAEDKHLEFCAEMNAYMAAAQDQNITFKERVASLVLMFNALLTDRGKLVLYRSDKLCNVVLDKIKEFSAHEYIAKEVTEETFTKVRDIIAVVLRKGEVQF